MAKKEGFSKINFPLFGKNLPEGQQKGVFLKNRGWGSLQKEFFILQYNVTLPPTLVWIREAEDLASFREAAFFSHCS
jgi:hypothetical protein